MLISEVKNRLRLALILFLLTTMVGTFGFMKLENLPLIDALYFNIVTMSTVGYGDIHPQSPASRLLAIFLIVAGGAAFLGVIANATEIFILRNEREQRRRKTNMMLGVFYSELGHQLLTWFAGHDRSLDRLKTKLSINAQWHNRDFAAGHRFLRRYTPAINLSTVDLSELDDYLNHKRDFLISILVNPVLVEHEAFSELMLAVFHLIDENDCRRCQSKLQPNELLHLQNDLNRVYLRLLQQWLCYLEHLKKHYPYLFSLAVRRNPFAPADDPTSSE